MIIQCLLVALSCLIPVTPLQDAPPGAVRLLDVNGDGALDRLLFDADGGMRIVLHVSGRDYAEVAQVLPRVPVPRDLLACDLDGDGHTDLYLVTPGPNLALLGDGTGHFVEATEHLGLLDRGDGLGVERCDLDADGRSDLLLHNRWGDVVFYGTGAGFERDAATPERPRTLGVPSAPRVPVPDAIGPGSSRDQDRSTGSKRTPVVVPGSSGTPDATGGVQTSSGPGGPTVGSAEPLSGAGLFGGMATSVRDMTTGQGVRVDSTPTFGRLLPLGPELFVDPGGDVGLGTLTPAAALHVEGTSPSGLALKVGDALTVRSDSSFTGVGRSFQIFSTEAFGVQSPSITGYGGMYVNTEGFTGQPFYGYATGGTARAWSYFHLPSAEWRLWNGTDRLTIGSDGEFRVQNVGLVVGANGNVAIGLGDTSGDSTAGSGLLRVEGNVSQNLTSDGLVKAAAVVYDTGISSVVRSFNNLPGGAAVTVSETGVGIYEVDFGTSVNTRFAQATLGGALNVGLGEITVAHLGNVVRVFTKNSSGSLADIPSFTLVVY